MEVFLRPEAEEDERGSRMVVLGLCGDTPSQTAGLRAALALAASLGPTTSALSISTGLASSLPSSPRDDTGVLAVLPEVRGRVVRAATPLVSAVALNVDVWTDPRDAPDDSTSLSEEATAGQRQQQRRRRRRANDEEEDDDGHADTAAAALETADGAIMGDAGAAVRAVGVDAGTARATYDVAGLASALGRAVLDREVFCFGDAVEHVVLLANVRFTVGSAGASARWYPLARRQGKSLDDGGSPNQLPDDLKMGHDTELGGLAASLATILAGAGCGATAEGRDITLVCVDLDASRARSDPTLSARSASTLLRGLRPLIPEATKSAVDAAIKTLEIEATTTTRAGAMAPLRKDLARFRDVSHDYFA